MYMGILSPHLQLFSLPLNRPPAFLFLVIALLWPMFVATQVFLWNRGGCDRHPVALALRRAGRGQPWRSVASSVNVEFRRHDKFASGPVGRQVVVTDSWVLVTSAYHLHVAHQSDVLLTLDDAEEHRLSQVAWDDHVHAPEAMLHFACFCRRLGVKEANIC